MNKNELREMILQEAIHIKALAEEKTQIEKKLSDSKEVDEMLTNSKGVGLPKTKNNPVHNSRVEKGHAIPQVNEDEISETSHGLGAGPKHHADRRQDTLHKAGARQELQEIAMLRKTIKK